MGRTHWLEKDLVLQDLRVSNGAGWEKDCLKEGTRMAG
jgi:hypothetical protein